MSQLAIEYRPLASLIPYARNSRTHSPEQIEDDDAGGSALAAAIARLAGEPSTARVADGLRLWLEGGDGVILESCLGLGSTWRSARRRPLASALTKAIVDYEARSWPRDRRSGSRRSGLPGLLFDLLALGAPPLSEGSIRAVVGKKSPGE